ncbi:Lipase_3 domain-containing protein [Meloidogyne graminicola]|uniref:Lipase_3 domain-containing protein n=1 Tax=Meloidogyne graminicola TaxID=189291 RepID=A0A8S9ZFP7_9BILA|nr:Lipase_3 domain-containing protein [Meloidogyne graminicola]
MSAAEHKALIFLLKNLNISTYFFYILTFLFFPLNTLAVRYRRQYYQQQPEVYSTFNSEQFTSQQLPLSQQPPSPNTQKQQFTAYNEPYARRLLALAAGAYSPTPPNGCERRWMPDTRLWNTPINQSCDALDNTCSSYTVVSEPRSELIIIFRGTKTKEQLFLEGWQSLQPGTDFDGIGKVNKYFARAFNTLWPSVKAALEDPRHSGYKVTFTGHSLGGALASLAALRTVLDNLRRSDQVQLYTFGQPRVGNTDFAAAHDKYVPLSFRVVHRMDIVPHMPACDKTDNWPGVRPKDDSKPCDPTSKGKAYHHGVEIWYPYGMKSW